MSRVLGVPDNPHIVYEYKDKNVSVSSPEFFIGTFRGVLCFGCKLEGHLWSVDFFLSEFQSSVKSLQNRFRRKICSDLNNDNYDLELKQVCCLTDDLRLRSGNSNNVMTFDRARMSLFVQLTNHAALFNFLCTFRMHYISWRKMIDEIMNVTVTISKELDRTEGAALKFFQFFASGGNCEFKQLGGVSPWFGLRDAKSLLTFLNVYSQNRKLFQEYQDLDHSNFVNSKEFKDWKRILSLAQIARVSNYKLQGITVSAARMPHSTVSINNNLPASTDCHENWWLQFKIAGALCIYIYFKNDELQPEQFVQPSALRAVCFPLFYLKVTHQLDKFVTSLMSRKLTG